MEVNAEVRIAVATITADRITTKTVNLGTNAVSTVDANITATTPTRLRTTVPTIPSPPPVGLSTVVGKVPIAVVATAPGEVPDGPI